MTAPTRQTVVAELRDRPGALYRVIGLVRRHGHNIERLTVVPSEQAGFRRVTVVIAAADAAADADRLTRQLERLVDVVSVTAQPLSRSEPWPSSTTTQMPTYDV